MISNSLQEKIIVNSHINHLKNDNISGIQIQINGSPGCKWWLKIEFEGDEIQIG